MKRYTCRNYACLILPACVLLAVQMVAAPGIKITTPMSPPAWALLEHELIRASTAACEEFFARYFDERGYLLCVTRWGGDDGPDDAIENCALWPELHALGAPDTVRQMYLKAQEGHIRQYTEAKTTEVPIARDGWTNKWKKISARRNEEPEDFPKCSSCSSFLRAEIISESSTSKG